MSVGAAAILAAAVMSGGLRAPAPLEPGEGMRTVVTSPHLAWRASPGAQRYRVELAEEREPSVRPLLRDTVHAVVRWYVVAHALAPGRYRWRVRAETEDGRAGAWSSPRRFTVVRPARTFVLTPATPLAEVRRAAREAARAPSARIVLRPGVYRWDAGYEGVVFRWAGAHDIVVEGRGAHVHLMDPSSQSFSMHDCRRITLDGLTLYHDPIPYTAMEVVAVDLAGAWLDGRVIAGFDGTRYPRDVNQFFMYAVAPDDFHRKHPDRPGHTYLATDGTTDQGGGVRRFRPRDAVEAGALSQLRPGDRALACYRRWPVSWMWNCQDMTWRDVACGHTEGSLFMGGGNADVKLLRVGSNQGPIFPASAGWVTGNDRRGPWIEGCVWEGPSDDGPNITGNSYMVERVDAPNRFLLWTGPSYQTAIWRPGDELLFWNPNTGMPLLTTRVRAAELQHGAGEPGGKQLVTIAAESVPGLEPGTDLMSRTHVYNLSTQNRQLVIRGNSIRGGRRFGFNIKAIDALIERNRFEGLASCALSVENESCGWEGICSGNMVIQDNTIIDCGYDTYSIHWRRADIHVNLWRNNPVMAETEWRGHRGIVIRRNDIRGSYGVGIGVDNAEDVRIVGNRFTRRPGAPPARGDHALIEVGERTRRVTVELGAPGG